jgi:PHP family Zn ribbon phosphoesterase
LDLLRQEQGNEELERKQKLKEEIREALKDWESAKRYFNYALGPEQVDYAIHAIITAEKRYTMLLSRAKKMKGPWPQWEGVFE